MSEELLALMGKMDPLRENVLHAKQLRRNVFQLITPTEDIKRRGIAQIDNN